MEYNENSIKIFFRNLCECILENENKIKAQRTKLYSFYCFKDNYGYFKYLDKNHKNYIDISDLSLFISINKIKCIKPLLNTILKKYDKDLDSCWNFTEYSTFINKDINISLNNINNNFEISESKIEIYEKELVKLIELEINYIKYIGIKIKALKELIYSKTINTKSIIDIIQKNKNKKEIDVNTLLSFLNDGEYHLNKEDIYKVIQMISGGNNFFTEKQLDKLFKYEKFVSNSELKYPQLYKGVDIETESLKKYEGEFPMNNCGVLYYNVYNNSKEVKDKNIENALRINDQFDTINNYDINNNNHSHSTFINEAKNKFYNTYDNINDNLNENLLLNSNNSNSNEFHFNSLNQFSFRK